MKWQSPKSAMYQVAQGAARRAGPLGWQVACKVFGTAGLVPPSAYVLDFVDTLDRPIVESQLDVLLLDFCEIFDTRRLVDRQALVEFANAHSVSNCPSGADLVAQDAGSAPSDPIWLGLMTLLKYLGYFSKAGALRHLALESLSSGGLTSASRCAAALSLAELGRLEEARTHATSIRKLVLQDQAITLIDAESRNRRRPSRMGQVHIWFGETRVHIRGPGRWKTESSQQPQYVEASVGVVEEAPRVVYLNGTKGSRVLAGKLALPVSAQYLIWQRQSDFLAARQQLPERVHDYCRASPLIDPLGHANYGPMAIMDALLRGAESVLVSGFDMYTSLPSEAMSSGGSGAARRAEFRYSSMTHDPASQFHLLDSLSRVPEVSLNDDLAAFLRMGSGNFLRVLEDEYAFGRSDNQQHESGGRHTCDSDGSRDP